jgi:hypothetical protein
MQVEPQSPWQLFTALVQTITWPALLGAVLYCIRLFNKADSKLENFSIKFDEVHKTITNDMKHSSEEMLTLLRKQDSRWEQYMITTAAVAKQAQAHHGD